MQQLTPFSKEEITHKAYKLGIGRCRTDEWTEHDIFLLVESYRSQCSVDEIYGQLCHRHSVHAIYAKASRLGIVNKKPWSSIELDILKQYYSQCTLHELWQKLPERDIDTIKTTAHNLGLKSLTYLERVWTAKSDKIIVSHWEEFTDKELGERLGRTATAVKARRHKRGIYRPVQPAMYEYVSEFIRKGNRAWKADSAKACSYKCMISDEPFSEIHHLHGMNLIVNEALDDLNMSTQSYMEYTEVQRALISDRFFECQKKYPLGVCLTKAIHKQFHDEYGYGDNTISQFIEFIEHNYPHKADAIRWHLKTANPVTTTVA